MAGRFERLVLSHWSARDLAAAFDIPREQATLGHVTLGAFPGAVPLTADLGRWRAYVRDAIIDPALGRDMLMLQTVRRPALLRQVFAVAIGHPAQILSLNKLVGSLQESASLETVAHYLGLLHDAYLVATLPKFSHRAIRLRASPPKLVPLNNAFLAAGSSQDLPSAERAPELWGAWVESACLALLVNSGQEVCYWREEALEVDAVSAGSWGMLAIEVKTAPYTMRDLRGLLEFCRRQPEYRPLVICDEQHTSIAQAGGLDALPWQAFLWDGPEALGG
jgi:uncharacterized protein